MAENTIQEDDTYVIHGPGIGEPLPTETVGRDIHRCMLAAPKDTLVMIDAFSGEKLLYSQLLQRSVNLAEALRRLGYRGQDTVLSISSENCLNFFVPVLASFFNGSILAPLNHSYTPYELEHTMNISTPKLVFCAPNVAQKFIDLKLQKLSYIDKIILLNSGPIDPKLRRQGIVQTMDQFVADVLKGRNVNPRTFEPVDGDSSKMAGLIMCSSGTTGLPKGVMLSHLNLMVRAEQSKDPKYFSTASQNILGIMPFFHAYGLCVCLGALISNATVICLNKFDEDIFLKSIQDYKITTLAMAPPLAVFLAKSDKVMQYDLSSITNMYCGAAPLSKETEDEVKRRLKCDTLRQGYGLTEATLALLVCDINNIKSGTCGKVISRMSCKVRDPETGRSLGPNQTGELCFKGPLVMMGYYKNEQATRATFTSDGWLKTGDLGYYDDEGFFSVIDRLKELIKFKGYQVAPAELEAILINHPKIKDAGVVGLPDELVGERPLAFVVKKEEVTSITEEEIKKHVADMVSPQKRLTGGVIFVDSVPKNPTGKILRRELRDLLKQYKKTVVESKL